MKFFLMACGFVLISGHELRNVLLAKRSCKRCSNLLRIRGGTLADSDVLSPSDEAASSETTVNLGGFNGESSSSSSSLTLEDRPTRLLGFTVSDLTSSAATRSAQVGTTLKKQLDLIRKSHASLSMPKVPEEWKDRSSEAIQHVAPAAIAISQLLFKNGDIRFPGAYALALLGSCCGFHLFLYFITVGYSLGVALPVSVALCIYSQQRPLNDLTKLHSGLTILWGVRSALFFLYREYVNWPQLHIKVVEVNKMARMNSKIFCWLVYSFCYATMATPCLYRLQSDKEWTLLGKIALTMQGAGLILEGVADYQKSAFKSLTGNRNQWCHVGLFRYSTFPNYLGELMFWYGTVFAAIESFRKPHQFAFALFGLVFITTVIRGAIKSLGAKQMRRYGSNPDFVRFSQTHSLVGPAVGFLFSKKPKSSQVSATTPSENS